MIWIKSSGLEIKTNDLKETIAYAKSLGWKEKSAKKEKENQTKKTKK